MAPVLCLSVLCALVLVATTIPAPPHLNPVANFRLLQSATLPVTGTLRRKAAVIHRSQGLRLSSSVRSFFREAQGVTYSSLVRDADSRKLAILDAAGVRDASVDKSVLLKRFARGHVTSGKFALPSSSSGRDVQVSKPRLLKTKMNLAAGQEVDQPRYSRKDLFPVARGGTGNYALLRAIATGEARTSNPTVSRSSTANKINIAKIALPKSSTDDTIPVLTRAGLTGDLCSGDSDCAIGRGCQAIGQEDVEGCPAGASPCICLPTSGLEDCTSSASCSTTGEVCAEDSTGDTACASVAFVEGNDAFTVVGESGEAGGTDSGSGLTGDICSADSDCAGGRVCQVLRQEDVEGCPAGASPCICFPTSGLEDCISSASCSTTGEVCAEDSTGDPACVSAAFVEDNDSWTEVDGGDSVGTTPPSTTTTGTITGTTTGITTTGESTSPTNGDGINAPTNQEEVKCIDAKALRHLSPDDLVFEKHTLSNVLCDRTESCATAGHMVTFGGKTMRMTTYCSLVECKKRVMEVNSPRYKRGLRVASNTEGLQFTAFAARYNTRAEEALISVAVRAGL